MLVIGVSPNHMTLLSELDAAEFEASAEPERGDAEDAAAHKPSSVASFASHLRDEPTPSQPQERGRAVTSPTEDLAELRADIQRLNDYLGEEPRREMER